MPDKSTDWRNTEAPETAQELELGEGEVLFKDEAPQEVVGFIQYVDQHGQIAYLTTRHSCGPEENLSNQIKEVIGDLKKHAGNDSKSDFGDEAFEIMLNEAMSRTGLSSEDLDLDAQHITKKSLSWLSQSDSISVRSQEYRKYKVNGQWQLGPAMFKLSVPTLFVFTTQYDFVNFTGDYIIPRDPSKFLFPWCQGVRLWESSKVLGWYSGYEAGKDLRVDKLLEPQLFWFDLVIQGKNKFLTSLMDPILDPP